MQYSDARKFSFTSLGTLWNALIFNTSLDIRRQHSPDGSYSLHVEGEDMHLAICIRRMLQSQGDIDVVPMGVDAVGEDRLVTGRRDVEVFNSIRLGELYLNGCGLITNDCGRPTATMYAHGACVVRNDARQMIAREVCHHKTLIITDLSLVHVWEQAFGNRKVHVVGSLTNNISLETLCNTELMQSNVLICGYNCFYPKHMRQNDVTFQRFDRFVVDAPYPSPVYPAIRRVASQAEHTWMCMPGFSRNEPTTLSWAANVLVGNAPVAVFPAFEQLIVGKPTPVQLNELSLVQHTVISDCSSFTNRSMIIDNNLATCNDNLFCPTSRSDLKELLITHSGMGHDAVNSAIDNIDKDIDIHEACPVCWTNTPWVLTGCGHSYCVECAYKLLLKDCAVCRRLITRYYCLEQIILEPAKIKLLKRILADPGVTRSFVVVCSRHTKCVTSFLRDSFRNVCILQGGLRKKASELISRKSENFICVVPFNFCTPLLAESVDRIIFVHPYTHDDVQVRAEKHKSMVQRLVRKPCAVDVLVCDETVESSTTAYSFF